MVMTVIATGDAVSDKQGLTFGEFTSLGFSYTELAADGAKMYADAYDTKVAKAISEQLGKELLEKVGIGVDIAQAGHSYVKSGNLAAKGDTDAAVLGGVAATADLATVFLANEALLSAAFGSATALSGGTVAIAAGVCIALSVALNYFKGLVEDTTRALLIQYSAFGTEDPGTIPNPETNYFRFAVDGKHNYARQTAAISSETRKYKLKSVRMREDQQMANLHFELDLGKYQDTDGELFLRPWFYTETETLSHTVAHKVNTKDANMSPANARSRCPYLPSQVRTATSDVKKYYRTLGDRLPGSGSSAKVPYMDMQEVTSELNKNRNPNYGSQGGKVSALERVNSVSISRSSDGAILTVDIHSKFAPALLQAFLVEPRLLRKKHYGGSDFGEAWGYLEVMYVPDYLDSESITGVLPATKPPASEDIRSILAMTGVATDILSIDVNWGENQLNAYQ